MKAVNEKSFITQSDDNFCWYDRTLLLGNCHIYTVKRGLGSSEAKCSFVRVPYV